MERVLILGSPGSGKTTLATKLSRATGLPLTHMDRLYWRPGWVESRPEEWEPQLRAVLEQPRWILDGNYGRTLALRLAYADTVVIFDLPTWVCLGRALRRIATGWGRDRADLTEGCPERFDVEFLWYIASFRRRQRPGLFAKLEGFRGETVLLRRAGEAERWLARIGVCSPAE